MLELLNSNALHIPLKDKSIHCVVTSPPYYGLRDYGTAKWEGGNTECDHTPNIKPRTERPRNGLTGGLDYMVAKDPIYREVCLKCGAIRKDGQIGLEASPEEYVTKLVEVFREIWRVLRDDGVVWLNLGDSYAGGDSLGRNDADRNFTGGGGNHLGSGNPGRQGTFKRNTNLKPKDLIGIPWRVAFALQADGWWLRSDIIWHKPNPMPESVRDRPTKSHEYIFLLTKSQHYYYDNHAILEPAEWTRKNSNSLKRGFATKENIQNPQHHGNNMNGNFMLTGRTGDGHSGAYDKDGKIRATEMNGIPARNKRSVWIVPTKPYKGAHFATFPPALVEPCILAGTSEKGCCPVCGKAWERVIERTIAPDEIRNRGNGSKMDFHTRQVGSGQKLQDWKNEHPDTTKGWQPSCKCMMPAPESRVLCIPEPIPCIVFDPFAGSGTTLLVARQFGRSGIGIDLSYNYLHEQARKRLSLDKLRNWIG